MAILLAGWLAGTALVLVANARATTTLTGAVTADMVSLLHANWAWYASGYALFFVSDCAIALLGVPPADWLMPGREIGGQVVVILFALSGLLGIVADVRMLAAAQLFRTGSALLAAATAAQFLDDLNTTCNWLSAASFLPAGIATWLVGAADGGRGAWAAFSRLGGLYQIATGLLPAASFLVRHGWLSDFVLIMAAIGMPVFAAVWLIWMLREMERRSVP
ncbi:MAG: hypothetical protein AB7P12_11080 [Alphaproteobacteria bacterium]